MGSGPARMASALALAAALTAAAPHSTPHRQSGPDGLSGGYHDRIMAEANPAAVLAWAKLNCFAGLELASNAPRTQMEFILQVAAAYDAESRQRGVAAVCADALAATVVDYRTRNRVRRYGRLGGLRANPASRHSRLKLGEREAQLNSRWSFRTTLGFFGGLRFRRLVARHTCHRDPTPRIEAEVEQHFLHDIDRMVVVGIRHHLAASFAHTPFCGVQSRVARKRQCLGI